MLPISVLSQISIRVALATLLGLASLMAGAAERTTTYLHTDHLGSPILARSAAGATVWQDDYGPWGESLQTPAGNAGDVGYTGHYTESGLGLTYAQARWYDQVAGVFLSTDAVAFGSGGAQHYNRYVYAYNNPYGNVDPSGNSPLDIGEFGYDVGNLLVVEIVHVAALMAGNDAVAYASAQDMGELAVDAAISTAAVVSPVPGSGRAMKAAKVTKGLTTPKKYFGSKTKQEVKDALEKKYGPPKSSREHADTYYNDKTKRSYNVHEEPGHNDGKPHIDIRRRGGYEERKYDLKEGE